jgi:GTP-binding protein EngB required for normal cell division
MSESHNPLIGWYRKLIRPFLGEHEPEKLAEFDKDARRIEEIEVDLHEHLPVCFLGGSGVGKSTLINALVFGAESYIPSGGVGPLTAQALTVCHGEHPSFEVHYHSVDRVNRVIFGLERHYQAQLGKQGRTAVEANPEEMGLEMTGEDEATTLNALANDDGDDKEKIIDEIRKQAVLMIAGSQDAERELPYLIDALLVAYGRKNRHGSQILPEDEQRIKGIQIALQYGKNKRPFTCTEGKDERFRDLLGDHATGYLAPVIRDLKVRWNIEMLKGGLTLVDLPGVGVAGDVKAEVTEKWIKEHAKAIILVVDTRGVRETEAELLRNSGFLSRLLHASGDPSSDPVVLMVAVTHADKIAEQEYLDNKSRFPQKRKAEYLAEVFEKVSSRIRCQVEEQLTKVWKFSTGLSETKTEVLQGIIANLQVFPVSAPEYRKLLLQDEDSVAFIKTPEQSNIPQMVAALQKVVKERTADRQQHLKAEESRFFNRLRARINVTKTQWEEETRAEVEADELRKSLAEFIETEKLRLEFSNRQGAFREFLKSTLPTQIAKVVTEASVKARKEVYAYMQDLQFAHWKTLQAAVRRGGTFYGSRHIDLPRDFALRFEEPIAEVWGKTLLREIRKRTREYADDSVAQVERILKWAKSQGARANTSLLQAQVEVIKTDAQKLNAVGKEAVEELREEVKNSLIKKIESPIRRKCKAFVESHRDEGSGVKSRILGLFGELADVTIEAATEPAIELLTERFRQVDKQIREVFDEHQEYNDPITSASNAVVSSHEERLRRSDKKKRELVLTSLGTIVGESPLPWEDKPESVAETAIA